MVIQQINLYLPEIQPRKDLVTAQRTLAAAVVLVVLMALVSGVNAWQHSRTTAELQAVQALVAAQRAQTERIERDVASRATDQALVREMNTREQRLAQAEDLYDFMRTTNLGNMTGFSANLLDIARAASRDGIWLTSFSILGNADYVSLQGFAEEAAMLPEFVGKLSMGQSEIRNRQFNRMSTSRMNSEGGVEPYYQFVLESSR